MRAGIALLGVIVIALTVAVASASPIDRPQTFSLLEIDESDASSVINGFEFQRLPAAGDRFAFRSGLYKWAGTKRGARVGRDEGLCTFVRVSPSEQNFSADGLCSASAFLPGGQIHVQGIVRFTEGPTRIEIPVIGGTGSYANARGFLRIRDLGSGDSGHSNLEFHLLP
jgi:Dirigent-like protein